LAECTPLDKIKQVFGVCDLVLEKKLGVRDIGIPYRSANHWDSEGLFLEANRREGQWHKFSLLDYLWIKMIKELREWGISFESIKTVKETLGSLMALSLSDAGQSDDSMSFFLKNTQHDQSNRSKLNILLLLAAECIISRATINILITKKGDCFFYNKNQHSSYGEDLQEFESESHIRICLKQLLREMILENKLDLVLPGIPLLSANEVELVKRIRAREITSLKVISPEMATKELCLPDFSESEKLEEIFLKSILIYNYQSITYVCKDGNTFEFPYQSWGDQNRKGNTSV